MTLPPVFQRFLTHVEKPVPAYTGQGETALAVAVMLLAFAYKLHDCLYGKQPVPGQPWPYMLMLSAFTAVAFSSAFFLATPGGWRFLQWLLSFKRPGWVAMLPVFYVMTFYDLLWIFDMPELETLVFTMASEPWSRLPLSLFLLLAAALLYGGFRLGLTLAIRFADKARAAIPKDAVAKGKTVKDFLPFGWRQLGCVLVAVLPFLVLQEQIPLLWCFTTPVAVVVLVHGTGLGREYFGYSFVPRSLREALLVIALLICGLLLFLLTTHWAGTVSYTGGLWSSSWNTVFDSVFVWLFIVGVSEEVIFRCGVLTLIAAFFAGRGLSLPGRHPRLAAVLATSLLFALSHLFRGATLIFLAFLASLLYGLAFVAGKSLFGPVLLHGFLNVLVLMNFHLADFH